jgi:hypothetical protein
MLRFANYGCAGEHLVKCLGMLAAIISTVEIKEAAEAPSSALTDSAPAMKVE